MNNKEPSRLHYHDPANPYQGALGYRLERVFYCLRDRQAHQQKMHIVVEKCGQQEDRKADGQIAAIARSNNLKLATRNIRDFEECGLLVINPFDNI